MSSSTSNPGKDKDTATSASTVGGRTEIDEDDLRRKSLKRLRVKLDREPTEDELSWFMNMKRDKKLNAAKITKKAAAPAEPSEDDHSAEGTGTEHGPDKSRGEGKVPEVQSDQGTSVLVGWHRQRSRLQQRVRAAVEDDDAEPQVGILFSACVCSLTTSSVHHPRSRYVRHMPFLMM